jgi:hypothetical protein
VLIETYQYSLFFFKILYIIKLKKEVFSLDILREMTIEAIARKIKIFEYNAYQLELIKTKLLNNEKLSSYEESFLEILFD